MLRSAIAGLVIAVTQGIFSYNGYGGAVYFAEETKNARRSIARAVLLSAVVTVAAEIIPLAAILLGTDSLTDLFSASLPVEAFLDERAGHAVTVFVLVSVALAIVNAIIAIALQSGRLLFAAARDQALPDALAETADQGLGSGPRCRGLPPSSWASSRCSRCLVPMDVLLNATGSTLAFSYGFIALAAIVMRRNATSEAGDGYRMPWWPMPPVVALLAILAIFVDGRAGPESVAEPGHRCRASSPTGFAYYFCYLRPRAGTHLLLLEVSDDEEV